MSRSAPGDLELVRAFVNTRDLESGADDLSDRDGLRAWLVERHLLDAQDRVAAADRERAVALREALRTALLDHNGGALDPGACALMDDAATRARFTLRFTGGGGAALLPQAPGVDGALGRLLRIVAGAQADGTWERLKACPAEDCLWAFYDVSRNRSSRWCTMEECGNRAKVRRYRERHAH